MYKFIIVINTICSLYGIIFIPQTCVHSTAAARRTLFMITESKVTSILSSNYYRT